MKYTKSTPCEDCPFLKKYAKSYGAKRLREFASGEFPCHKTAKMDEDESVFLAAENSLHCAGALIYNEKRNQPHQMMRIAERLGMYDMRKLNMKAEVA